jgi:hypothetical protein
MKAIYYIALSDIFYKVYTKWYVTETCTARALMPNLANILVAASLSNLPPGGRA